MFSDMNAIELAFRPVSFSKAADTCDLYPPKLIEALGGEENIKRLKENPIHPVVVYNFYKDCELSDNAAPAEIQKGFTHEGHPFFLIHVPGCTDLVFYYTKRDFGAFSDLAYWRVSTATGGSSSWDQPALVFTLLSAMLKGECWGERLAICPQDAP